MKKIIFFYIIIKSILMQDYDIDYRLFVVGDSTDENKSYVHSLVGSNYEHSKMFTFSFNKL